MAENNEYVQEVVEMLFEKYLSDFDFDYVDTLIPTFNYKNDIINGESITFSNYDIYVWSNQEEIFESKEELFEHCCKSYEREILSVFKKLSK